MAEIEVTEFTAYSFNTKEYPLAFTYTELQLQGIQTQLAKYAQQRVSSSAESYVNIEMYIRAQEYQRGLMDGMRYLLELHRALRDEAAEVLAEQQAAQETDSYRTFQDEDR